MATPPRVAVLLTAFVLVAVGVVLASLAATGNAPWSDSNGSGSASEACPEDATPITHGPRVGAVTDGTAKIWVRGCRQVEVAVRYKPASEGWGGAAVEESPSVATDPAADHTAVVQLSGLSPATRYDYRIVVDGGPVEELAGRFGTMPDAGAAGELSFVFGADVRPEGAPHVVFDQMAALEPDLALLIGDQIYVDPQLPPEEPFFDPDGKEDYERVYREVWTDGPFRRFLANVPTVMMWDDHEILNDWDQKTDAPYPWARAAFEEYAASANPAPAARDELYYIVAAGDAELFVLDTRTFRDPGEAPDQPSKTMLGLKQKAALKTWLLGSQARFKLIVSSVMWSDFARHEDEAWLDYASERRELLDFVREHGITGVVLLSGDEHWTGVFRLPPWETYELSPTPLSGYAGIATRGNLPQVLFKLSWTTVFGHVRIDTAACPARLDFQVIDARGKVWYELSLSEFDLDPVKNTRGDYCAALAQGRLDSDGDGCADGEERGDDETRGGRRDPRNHWDFYDVNGDRRVDSADAIAVAAAVGTAAGDEDYDPVFDRSAPPAGGEPWELGPPDGAVNFDDFFLVLEQVGHACEGPP